MELISTSSTRQNIQAASENNQDFPPKSELLENTLQDGLMVGNYVLLAGESDALQLMDRVNGANQTSTSCWVCLEQVFFFFSFFKHGFTT